MTGRVSRLALAGWALALTQAPAHATEARQASFGALPDGRRVEAVTLTNRRGIAVTVITYGAAIQSVILPDQRGRKADVALGYPTIADYLAKPQYLGATVGRYANRIARGAYAIDGRRYQAPVNNGPNTLHGGAMGFDKVLWRIVEVRPGPTGSVVMRYVSPDGDQGYPGALTVDATYSLDEAGALTIAYRATTDRATIVNITNHAYWNLAGEGSPSGAMGHRLAIPAAAYLPTDAGAIPTGERRAVAGTAFDFRVARPVGARVRDAADAQIAIGRGYDHNWIVTDAVTPGLHLMARVDDPISGRGFDLWSNQPGLQFYSGNFLDGTSSGKSGRSYRMGDAIVLEPQLYPDTPNQPAFGSAVLSPGQVYRNVIVYRFRTRPTGGATSRRSASPQPPKRSFTPV